MRIRIIVAALLISASQSFAAAASCSGASAALKGPVGLDGVDFDRWTAALFDSKMSTGSWSLLPANGKLADHIVSKFVLNILEVGRDDDVCGVAARFSESPLPRLCDALESCKTLVEGLLLARHRVRSRGLAAAPRDKVDRKMEDLLLLLDTLSSETAVAMVRKFPTAQAFVSKRFDASSPCPKRQGRLPPYFGEGVCQGDVIVGQKMGAFSIFNRFDDRMPNIFTHTAIAYVRPEDPGALRVIDSVLEDGMKVRPFNESFGIDKTWRLRVYRLRGASDAEKLQLSARLVQGVDQVYQKMSEAAGGDPESKTAAAFDFEADMSDPERVFCSEAVMQTYQSAGMSGWLNPYPSELWRRDVRAEGGLGVFVTDGAGMDPSGFPSPGLVDMNPNFELVLEALNGKGLANERVGSSVIDSLLARIRGSDPRILRYIEKAKRLPRGHASRMRLVALASKIGGPSKAGAMIHALTRFSMSGVTERSAVAYFLLLRNLLSPDVMGPVASAHARVGRLEAEQGRTLGLNAVRKISDEEVDKSLEQLDEWTSGL
ncbi:MAG: hypothetical protein HY078_07895 [Elusimicrobia bacterium]|nr:hypothetical protein [Elusimicrobiota bacterium]